MLEAFYLDLAHVCNGFQEFLGVFAGVFRSMFQVFLRTYVVSVASRYFRSRSDVAYVMRVGSRRGHECAARVT
jgi:hypothetical protein